MAAITIHNDIKFHENPRVILNGITLVLYIKVWKCVFNRFCLPIESIPKQVDKKSGVPKEEKGVWGSQGGDRGLEFSRRRKGQCLFFSLHSLVLVTWCKEIEENNTMGKTRDFFKKIRDTKGTFHAKMGLIKDRNGMDLTEAEDIKKRW